MMEISKIPLYFSVEIFQMIIKYQEKVFKTANGEKVFKTTNEKKLVKTKYYE